MGSFDRQWLKEKAYLEAEKQQFMSDIITVDNLEQYFETVLNKGNTNFNYEEDDFVL